MKQENEFVLPEKWYIIVTEENKSHVNKWYANGDSFLKPFLHICGMVKQYGEIEKGYNEINDIKNGSGNDFTYDFGTEITFEQFKEHVLKEIPKPEYNPKDVTFKNDVYSNSEFNSESKIVGYKLIKEEYREVACKIAFSGREGDFFNLNGGINFKNNSGAYYNLKEAGVMHWFEPVFEEKKIKLTSGIELTEKDLKEVKKLLETDVFFF